MRVRYAVFLCSIFLFPLLRLQGQGTQVEFGKNRIQYHQDFAEWSQYESDNFIAYWYGEGRFVGQAAVQIAEYDFSEIQNLLEHRINEKMEIIVYTDLTDLKQSNIGIEEAFTNTGGQTKIVGNKMFVYFNGDHNHLRRQLREGIASIYMEAMLFGSNLQEIVQNAVMMNLPNWFKIGLVDYVGLAWSTELDEQLRDVIMSEDFKGFDRFAESNPKLAGHAMWYFISENFGPTTVSNLLYLTRINRSIESGFLYVLGSPYDVVVENWHIYFRQRFEGEARQRDFPAAGEVKFKNKRKLPITQAQLSPDGTKLAYVLNEIGRYKIFVHDIATGKREVIFKKGFRNAFQATDYNYPLISWNPTGYELAIMYEHRDKVRLLRIDLLTKKKTTEPLSTQFQRIYSMDYTSPNTMVFSAAVRGHSDLFSYFLNTRQTQRITNDFWDDLDVTFVKIGRRRGLVFSSNRPDSLLINARMDSLLPLNSYDLWFYDLTKKQRDLIRITNTPLANEHAPVLVDTAHFAYLSDRSGIYNREMARLEDYIHHYEHIYTLSDGDEIALHVDSVLTGIDSNLIDTIVTRPVYRVRAVRHNNTNLQRNLQEHHTSARTSRVVDVITHEGRPRMFVSNLDPTKSVTAPLTVYFRNLRRAASMSLKDGFMPSPFNSVIPERRQPDPPAPEPAPQQAQPQPQEDLAEQEPVQPEPDTSQPQDSGKIDIDNYLFQSEFDDEEEAPQVVIKEQPRDQPADAEEPDAVVEVLPESEQGESPAAIDQRKVYRFRPGRIIPSRLKFRTDFVTISLDNSLLFDGLTVADDPNTDLGYPPPGILLRSNWKDLFEDYEFDGGIRIPTTFDGSEYFLTFKDKKKRIDKHYSIYRRSTRTNLPPENGVPRRQKVRTLLGQVEFRYPLDIFRSLRARVSVRDDRTTLLASDRNSLQVPSSSQQRLGLRLEYVFDNTLNVSLNILNGTRYKVYAEVVKRFELQVLDGFSFDFGDGFMTIFGVDARHYQRLLKHSVIALRFAGATSFGQERMLYKLGGVDNWLFASENTELPPPDGNFAYQALAAPVRGFQLNARNGGTYAVFNTELRIPIFRYISKRLKSSFLRNFQLVGFFDAGTAWNGRSPYDDDNPLNTTEVGDNLIRVKVKLFRDPLIAGYGMGLRTTLFGYFIRLDYAWGIETRQVLDPRFYFALGTDF